MRVAVTGATGYVGRFVVAELLRRGDRVRAWARPESDRLGFPDSVDWVEGGLGLDGTEVPLLKGCDSLVHAAFSHVPGRYRGGEGTDPRGFMALNIGGSKRLIGVADRLGIERVVFLSSRAVYGPRRADRPLDESHPTAPDTLYGRYKLLVERAIVEAARGRAWSILRPTGVYGIGYPVMRSKWFDVVRASLAGTEPAARGGTEVGGSDLAVAMRLLLEAPIEAVAGQAFNASDVYVTHRAVTRLAGGALASPSGPPSGVMTTDRLQALGWRPSGWQGVATTVRGLVTEAHGHDALPADRDAPDTGQECTSP